MLGKLRSKQPSKVFNGVFYNLDALVTQNKEIKPEFKYEDENELYEFYESLGEGAFSTCFRAKFIPTGETIAVKILKPERESE